MKARVYTKTGDKGETSLVGGTRVAKCDVRLDAYGTLDELNAIVGVLRSELVRDSRVSDIAEARLREIQNNLFNIGSHFACESEEMRVHLPGLHAGSIASLEKDMDQWETELPPLREFILPGGIPAASLGHQARTVCRRSEREAVRLRQGGGLVSDEQLIYVNRLSDWFFLLSRKLNARANVPDVTWQKKG